MCNKGYLGYELFRTMSGHDTKAARTIRKLKNLVLALGNTEPSFRDVLTYAVNQCNVWGSPSCIPTLRTPCTRTELSEAVDKCRGLR